MISFRRVQRVGIYYDRLAPPASKEKHAFHFVKSEMALMFPPERVTVLTDEVADFAEKEVTLDRHLARSEVLDRI